MDTYKGIKASELIKELKKYIKNYGDLYICREKNGDARPIHFITYFPNSDYFELS